MYNKEKLEKEITTNDYIYCDTCIAMSKGFEHFIDKFAGIFKKHKKKMIIIPDVYQELLYKAVFGDESEKHFASRAVDLINSNIEIFDVEDGSKLNKHTFADPKLLARLIENKANSSQMLITKDGDLSLDANRFNSFSSINGKPIKVCYVNKYGDMNRFGNGESQEPKQKVEYIEVEKIVEKPVIKYVKEKPSFMDAYAKPAGAAIATYVIINNRKKIYAFINNAICKAIEMVA